jgi:agmatine/peptidylarginine deiminase
MGRHWFNPAVYVESNGAGRFYAVTSAEKAAELLMAWPERSNEWEEAFRACAAAVHGKRSADEARIAFERAAAAANRLILASVD